MVLLVGNDRRLILVVAEALFFLVSLWMPGIQGNERQTCSCSSGCAPNQLCDPAGSCEKENVAYGKEANVSSTWPDTGPGCTAVNGRTGHVLKYLDDVGTNCVHTSETDPKASWSVDLGRSYTITDIVIYNRQHQITRLAGIWIYVDDEICKKFPGSTPKSTKYGLTYTAVCDSPVRGRIVRFSKEGPIDNLVDHKFINFCEVQIWVCEHGRFGERCDQLCHCLNDSPCDNHYGNCTSGCEDGYYGNTCSTACGECLDDAICDSGNGHCPSGCKTGYQPPYCNETCQNKTYGDNCMESCGQCEGGAACNVFNGTCPTCEGNFSSPFCKECVAGFYGSNCSSCGQCKNDAVCNASSGHCPNGCKTGYEAPLCKDMCKDKMYGDNCTESCGQCDGGAACNVFNGTCLTCKQNFSPPFCKECLAGFYGDDCSEACGQCMDDAVCDSSNGHCPEGCKTGYESPLCKDTCQNKTYGDNCAESCGQCEDGAACNVFNGTCPTCEGNFSSPLCKDCIPGFYGEACSEICGQCTDDAGCGVENGHCLKGCKTGYAPPLCKNTCQDKTYGDQCKESCGQCEGGAACNVFNGTCLTCKKNFSQPFCKDCLSGLYGDACSETCGQCMEDAVCSASNGHCPKGCKTGYIPPLCKEGKLKEPFPTDAVIGGSVAAVVVAVLVAVTGIFLISRRRRKQKSPSDASNASLQSESGTDPSEHPLSFHPIQVKDTKTHGKPSVKSTSSAKSASQTKKTKVSNETNSRQQEQKQQQQQKEQGVYANDSATPSTTNSPPPARPARISTKTDLNPEAEMETPFLDDDESDAALYGNIGNVYTTLKSSKPELDNVQKYFVGRLASEGLRGEFQTIPKVNENEPMIVSSLKVNAKKNRYAGIAPYDKNRVVLTDGYNEGSSTDYINASYISGYKKERKYIAAQGPKDHTVADFWRMVWQEKVTHIVMLTNLQEQGRGKCEMYWPDKEEASTTTFPPVTVTNTNVERRDHFYTRTFTVTKTGSKESREVTQYHYESWPDHGVPTTVSLARFWRHVTNRSRDSHAPLLVHCSAGVGRTGTFIGLDLGMEIAVQEGRIDVLELVKRLRQERTLMVQAMDQYVCLYEVLLEAYTARDTCFTLNQFDVIFPQPITKSCENERIDTEFKALMEMQPLFSQRRYVQATQDENMVKNRNPSKLPADDHLVYLMQHEPGRNQYINAVFMPTFRDPRGSILTQLPLPSTLVDFWRMVYGSDITTIVSLSSPGEKEEVTAYCQYWPESTQQPVQCGAYKVSLQSRQTLLQCLTSYDLSLVKTGIDDQRLVQLLHYVGWDGESGGDSGDILQLIDSLTKSLTEARRPKLVVQCCDGVSKSGLFSALCDIINSMTYDRELDVYLAVRHVQNVTQSAVTSLEQYRYIYHVAQQRYREMSIYANC